MLLDCMLGVATHQHDVRRRQRGDELRGLCVVCVRREGYCVHAHTQRHLQRMQSVSSAVFPGKDPQGSPKKSFKFDSCSSLLSQDTGVLSGHNTQKEKAGCVEVARASPAAAAQHAPSPVRYANPALAPARVMTCEGESSSCRASVPCTAKSAMMTPLRGSSHLRPQGKFQHPQLLQG